MADRIITILKYITVFCFFVSGISIVVYAFFLRDASVPAPIADSVVKKQLNELQETFLNTNKLSLDQITRGFWVSYVDPLTGVENLVFINASTYASGPLSKDDIARLSQIVSRGTVIDRSKLTFVANKDLPPILQFHNMVYDLNYTHGTTPELKAELKQRIKKHGTPEDYQALAYVSELEGDYAQRDALLDKGCVKNPTCITPRSVPLSGAVIDAKGNPVQGATITVISRPKENITVTTDQLGVYRLSITLRSAEKIRIKAHKRNYSDGFVNIIAVTPKSNALRAQAIRLESPVQIATIDYRTRTVTGTGNSMGRDKSVIVRTDMSTYTVPYGIFVTHTGQPWRGSVADVYLYEFSQANPPSSFLQLDTFDTFRGFVGDAMTTYGMPYIQFFDQETGDELHVVRSNPFTIEYKIKTLDVLRTKPDEGYRALSDQDMHDLVLYSVSHPFGVTSEFLKKSGNPLPPFWVFDRKRGVWDNTGLSVLTVDGDIRAKFYTIRD